MEMHLVHADKEGNLAVVAVMLTEGAANPTCVFHANVTADSKRT